MLTPELCARIAGEMTRISRYYYASLRVLHERLAHRDHGCQLCWPLQALDAKASSRHSFHACSSFPDGGPSACICSAPQRQASSPTGVPQVSPWQQPLLSAIVSSHTAAMPLPPGLDAGVYVSVTTQRQELNTRLWQVVEEGREGRVVLRDPDNALISVSLQVVHPLALVPFTAPAAEPRIELNQLESFVLTDGLTVNQWIPLPRLGGNWIMLRPSVLRGRSTSGSQQLPTDLIMYPRLHSYEVWFYSTWDHCSAMLMMECDVLKVCPAGQVWPWCSYCNRFLLPAESHRASRRHVKFRERLCAFGQEYVLSHALTNFAKYSSSGHP